MSLGIGLRVYLKVMGTTDQPHAENQMIAFNVYKGTRLIDTVFYSKGVKVDRVEVKRSLVNHDGYDADIRVTKARQKKNKAK